ncbi:hypothetical protein SAY87_024361 [Trapa incisa]|uniref:non-specific serine/threonine protein kinase n=2 Tax=Pentapetalae TaxID=1437201 RepID=A0AAN7GBW2_9MYRT|nr:hypothetical protein SAY87_024361 [Trapa incisa]
MADQGLEGSQPVDLSKHPSGIVPTLQNIVSTVNLDCKLDLKAIALQARNAEYNPKRFAAVIMRIREPKTTALIFASGKMVCTGAKSEQQSKLAARKYARIIQKLGFPAKFKDFKIQNIVGSCDVKFPIRLEGLAYSHGAFSSYEPELFPGLIYRMKQPKIVLLIFVSGKIVLTGAKVRDETYTAFENIYPVLTEFRKVQQWFWVIKSPQGQTDQEEVVYESPNHQSPTFKSPKEEGKLPTNPKEVEDLRSRDSATNPLVAFTYKELKIITANFRQDQVLGGGGFGSVYKGFITDHLREGLHPLQVAVKVHDGDNSYQGHREWLAEVIYLGQLSHPNLVKLAGYCCEDEHRVLVYEYMPRGSVEHNLFSRVLLPLSWSIRMKIALGAAKGLAFLHEAEKPVIYRDFKTSNILLDMDYNAKLSDFGLAKDGPVGDKSHVSTRIMGTYGYAAPEYIMTGEEEDTQYRGPEAPRRLPGEGVHEGCNPRVPLPEQEPQGEASDERHCRLIGATPGPGPGRTYRP